MPTPLSQKLKAAGMDKQPAKPARTGPLWKGPQEDGITFSLLSRFLVCRERFRCLVVEGLAPNDQFNHRLEFGNMWHLCEESLGTGYDWHKALLTYCRNLAQRYPTDQEQVDKWYNVVLRQFPIYLDYWKTHKEVAERKVLLSETAFSVPYNLPSGRTVLLRGKWDSVDLVGKGKRAGIYLQENKTKGDIDEVQIKRQLTFDLQTMIYLVALHTWQNLDDYGDPVRSPPASTVPIHGVIYNVIRRPLSGGKGTIVQSKGTSGTKCTKCKGEGRLGLHPTCPKCGGAGRMGGTPPETKQEYYDRLAKYISDEPQTYFMRWKVEVGPHDVDRFRKECLDPILENLYDWWEFMLLCDGDPWNFRVGHPNITAQSRHWKHPFGVYNPLDEGGHSDLDEYLSSGSEAGLTRITNLFPELT